MPTDQVTQFAERLTTDSCNIDSILTYPHPFTSGGLVVVFSDAAGSYSQLYATVICATPPAGELHIVKRNDLFLLSVPNGNNPLAPPDYPHMVFFLRNRGQLVYGEDLREHISAPSCIEPMLTYLLDITACWFRDHRILHDLQTHAYASLVDAIDSQLRFLMAIALLCRTGQWDVQADLVPGDFFSEFADERLRAAWEELDELRARTSSQDTNWESAVRAAWLFEVFTRGLRRHAP
jgi:hypothetical protein